MRERPGSRQRQPQAEMSFSQTRQSNSYYTHQLRESKSRCYSANSFVRDQTNTRSSGSWTSQSDSTAFNFKGRPQKTCLGRVLLSQRCYFLTGLVFNMALLAVYSVVTFSAHEPCLTPTGSNISKGFEFAFKLGMLISAADFVNSAFFEFFIRPRN